MNPPIAASAELHIAADRRRLFLDGVEFPWATSGISYERRPDRGLIGYVTVRIPVERYREVDLTATPVQSPGANRQPIPYPPGYAVVPDETYRAETKPIGGGAELP